MRSSSLVLATLALSISATAAFADPVVNGGFEADGVVPVGATSSNPNAITGWTAGGDTSFTAIESVPSSDFAVVPNSGTYAAVLGPFSPGGTLSQTISDTAGATYSLSFWLAAECAIGPACNDGSFGPVTPADNNFSATVAGQTLSLTNVTETGDGFNAPSNDAGNPIFNGTYDEYTLNFTGTGSDTIGFSFYDNNSYLALDDVSVTDTSVAATPEPSTLLLFGTGSLVLAGLLHRRNASNLI